MWKLVRMSLHCFSLFFSSSLLSELTNQVCERALSCWRLSLPGLYYEDASAFSVMIVYYVHTKLGVGRQRC